MTATSAEQAASQVNGSGPPPSGEQPAEQPTTAGERIMGVIGLAFAIGLALIGLDLITGGAVARLLGAKGEGDAGSGG
jgi:hypothetical protein